jgi:hypothetical protein
VRQSGQEDDERPPRITPIEAHERGVAGPFVEGFAGV